MFDKGKVHLEGEAGDHPEPLDPHCDQNAQGSGFSGITGVGVGGGGGCAGADSGDNIAPYTVDELARWRAPELKELVASLGINPSGCVGKRDIIEKIARHPGGLAAAAEAAIARGEAREEGHVDREESHEGTADEAASLVGMSLADYMTRSAPSEGPERGRERARARSPRSDVSHDRTPAADSARGLADTAEPGAAPGSAIFPRVVRIAPAHIAPPKAPVPRWVMEIQVSGRSGTQRVIDAARCCGASEEGAWARRQTCVAGD